MNLLDNIFWNALQGPQAHFAIGTGEVRRYAPGYCPVAGFQQAGIPDFAALAAMCEPGEQIYCDGWRGPVPHGWCVNQETSAWRMVWDAPIPANDQATDAIKLDSGHAEAACRLAALARPVPFGNRSLELGDYFGYVENDQLVAMAGERLAADGLREISGVCVHPDCESRGMLRRLVAKLVRRQLMRGETPFLHVMHDHVAAHCLFQRMGFRDHCLSPVRIISRYAAAA